MQSTSEGCLNIADLANQLCREKIFINSERQILQNLNEELDKTNVELLQEAWVCSHQRQNLTDLITSRCEADSVAACQRASALEETTFIDVHKVFKFKEANALAELFGWLRDSPHLVSLCLLLGEDDLPPSLPSALVAGLYGSCRLAVDRTQFLAVIRLLIKHHLAPAPDPRKLFRSSKSALPLLYGVFKDGHTPARQFLIAALSGPVMNVLQEDEFFLDIDPDKAMERFNQTDRTKKFGQANSPEYAAKAARYRKWTIQSLYNLTNQFIISLREHWNCFPTSIAWILQQIVLLLKQHSRISERELHSLCTELVLSNYICAAIVNPEAHGVLELPVSYIARSNLLQIAQILQVLCAAHTHEVEPKLRDLYSKFDRTCVSSLLHSLTTAPSVRESSLERTAVPTEPASHTARAMFTQDQLVLTINFLKRVSSKLNNNTPSVTSEEAYRSPDAAVAAEAAAYCETGSDGSSSGSEGNAANLQALLQSIEPNYRSRLHDLLKKMPDFTKISPTSQPEKESPDHSLRKSILAKVPMPRLPRSSSFNSALVSAPNEDNGSAEEVDKVEPPRVIVITLASKEDHDYVGLLPESKVLECYYGGAEAADGVDTALAVPGAPAVQKRTRFSVSHDEVSLGNTSDMLEAVSEAASNHSVTSSLELETEDQNDNLSDMVSANVSGRGSPNISGRETPSSQVTDGDAPGDGSVRRFPQNAPVSQQASNNAQKLLKQTRNEIEDKFCKFEIRKLLEGDETISIMSDTWSTDVLASDSETIGDAEQTQIQANTGTNSSATIAPDVSETASESAWSMDVLASDSDRNTEVDTDDCVSVAARSDTSWPRRPSQQDEPSPAALQNLKKPDTGSPRHTARPLPNRSGGGYLCATAQLSRGAELDLAAHHAAHHYAAVDNRKSILVNGYPVMTCYTASAPDSPGTAQAPPLPNDVFEYEPPANNYQAETESTLEDGNSDATSQWVDDSFPSGSDERYKHNGSSKRYEQDDNSSESSFNALRVEHYAGRFEPNPSPERPSRPDRTADTTDARSSISELMSRMSSATISSSTLVTNITQRIVNAEIRTSVVSISSSRLDKKSQPSASNNMSQSWLSVNSAGTSVSDRSSSQDVNPDLPTERRVSPPPQPTPPFKASTGAIPKSISFDATAEKNQRRRITGEDGLVGNLDDLKNNVKRSGGNLFNKIRMFRQKGRSHTHTNGAEIKVPEEEPRPDETPQSRLETAESSEDILAKYRRKSSSDSTKGRRGSRRGEAVTHEEIERAEGVLDLNDPEAFNSMKRKLRMVLSNADLYCVESVHSGRARGSVSEWVRCGAALSAREAAAAAGGEAARVLAAAGGDALAARLAAALRSDLAARRPYAAYLAACRANLAVTHHALRRQVQQIRAEAASNARAAAAARVLDQLERGSALRRLYSKLARRDRPSLTDGELLDERASRLSASIKAITAEVKADPSWDGASPTVLEMVEITVERAVYARLYLHVMFPNGDGDIARDQVLAEHIRRLGGARSRSRAAPPYARALQHLRRLAVARAPRDKIACIMKCVQCIMAALALNEGVDPSADDLMPVLIYVVIRVNPPSLLSTIELVNALGGTCLSGEALYWWTQFCAAVAYIKTMDYTS